MVKGARWLGTRVLVCKSLDLLLQPVQFSAERLPTPIILQNQTRMRHGLLMSFAMNRLLEYEKRVILACKAR